MNNIFWDLKKIKYTPSNAVGYALKKKLRYYLGIFPKWRTPPSPPFGDPLFEEKNYRLFCILGKY